MNEKVKKRGIVEMERTQYPEFTEINSEAFQIMTPCLTKTGNWIADNNATLGHYTRNSGDSMSVTFYGNEFWVYGTIDPSHGQLQFSVDGEVISTVSCTGTRDPYVQIFYCNIIINYIIIIYFIIFIYISII